VGALVDHLGPIPMAGCFAAGEIGPVGGKNFVHGFTVSVALFRDSPDHPDTISLSAEASG